MRPSEKKNDETLNYSMFGESFQTAFTCKWETFIMMETKLVS